MADGTLIGGRYRLSQPVGRGLGGFVWIAQDLRLQRTVAAKALPLPKIGTPATAAHARSVVLGEATQVCRLKHPNAVTAYEAFIDGDDVWLITEYVPARTMSDFISGHGSLDPSDVASLGAQLAGALAAAHRHGLVHRAVEPSNVLLADDGGVQIADFGLGDHYQDAAYRAPEVTSGAQPSPASDTYSLGATLFMALQGIAPFGPRGTDAAPSPPDPVNQHHRWLIHVLMRMLSADPALRPPLTGIEVALRAVADGTRPPADALTIPAPAATSSSQDAPSARPPVPGKTATAARPERAHLAWQPAPAPGRSQEEPRPATRATPQARSAVGNGRQASTALVSPRALFLALALLIAALLGILFAEFILL